MDLNILFETSPDLMFVLICFFSKKWLPWKTGVQATLLSKTCPGFPLATKWIPNSCSVLLDVLILEDGAHPAFLASWLIAPWHKSCVLMASHYGFLKHLNFSTSWSRSSLALSLSPFILFAIFHIHICRFNSPALFSMEIEHEPLCAQ